MLGPGSGGGVVPALPEFDQSGAGVFDSGMECLRVLPGSVAGATGGEGLHPPRVVGVGEGHGGAVAEQSDRVVGAVEDEHAGLVGGGHNSERLPGGGVIEHVRLGTVDAVLLDFGFPVRVGAPVHQFRGDRRGAASSFGENLGLGGPGVGVGAGDTADDGLGHLLRCVIGVCRCRGGGQISGTVVTVPGGTDACAVVTLYCAMIGRPYTFASLRAD